MFDVADPNLVMGRRNVSTTSTQALYLLNSPFALEQAKHAAIESLESKEKRRIERAYWKTLGRSPTVKEKQLATRFLSSLTKSSTEKERIQTWARLYQVLFACVDFRYLN